MINFSIFLLRSHYFRTRLKVLNAIAFSIDPENRGFLKRWNTTFVRDTVQRNRQDIGIYFYSQTFFPIACQYLYCNRT